MYVRRFNWFRSSCRPIFVMFQVFKVTNRKVKESVLPPEHVIDSPTGICIGKLKLNQEK